MRTRMFAVPVTLAAFVATSAVAQSTGSQSESKSGSAKELVEPPSATRQAVAASGGSATASGMSLGRCPR